MKLNDSITTLTKIGPSMAKKLERLEIFNLQDLLYHFPFRYEDSSVQIKISDLVNHTNEVVTVKAKVLTITQFRTKFGKQLVQAKIYDETGTIDAMWFNQSYITSYLKVGIEAIFYGKLYVKGKKVSLSSPKYEVVDSGNTKFLGKISGVYPETYGLTSHWLKSKIQILLDELTYNKYQQDRLVIDDSIPENILKKYELTDIITALKYIHSPEDFDQIEIAKKRLSFDEILKIQRQVLENKKLRQRLKSIPLKSNSELLEKFISHSPFTPTGAQIRSTQEIISDLQKTTPMNRLLEGDVGSGKTWVAAATALQTLQNGYDVAFLAPTSVLANQHSRSLINMLTPFQIESILVTSGTNSSRKKKDERTMLLNTNDSQGKLFVGTHALLFDPGIIKNLGMVIVDEQHRFGVKQREFLLELESESVKYGQKTTPHFLSMTATPIPRSMALTVFGDLDLSILDELPKERIKIDTFIVEEQKRSSCYDWAKKELSSGNQMFVICPLIEESEMLQAKSVITEYDKIKKEFSDFKVELLHGKMKEKEKAFILERFQNKEFDILVATSVIEVGIDIKDATIIIIESAERFGLAQLHQLRGRVGRSNKKSYCVLFSTDDNFPDRLKFFAKTDLGIKLAEFDLQSRGPGEVYGTKQSGIPKLRIANIMDVDLVKKAREALSEM